MYKRIFRALYAGAARPVALCCRRAMVVLLCVALVGMVLVSRASLPHTHTLAPVVPCVHCVLRYAGGPIQFDVTKYRVGCESRRGVVVGADF